MDVYEQIAVRIIQGQEAIIGPVALEQAQQVAHLSIDWDHHQVTIDADKVTAIDELIERFKDLFGNISVEVCREAASSLVGQLPAGNLPEAFK